MKIKHHPGTPCNLNLKKNSEKIPIIDGRWGFHLPQKLEIELTRNCNLNCIHCWNNSSKKQTEILI